MSKPKGIITPKEAKALNERWMETRSQAVDRAAHKTDNCSSWWSLEDIRAYLDFAEAEAKKLGYTMDGIRVYLGAYGNDEPEDKAGYTTMFFAPTGSSNGTSERSKSEFTAQLNATNGDIPGGPPLNAGSGGNPPNATYPN